MDAHEVSAARAFIEEKLAECAGPAKPLDLERPFLDMRLPFLEIGRQVGELARRGQLFRHGDEFVTVSRLTGELRAMTSNRFCSWVETIARPFEWKDGERKVFRMGAETAAKILESDTFRAAVKILRAVHDVKLPVLFGEGADRQPVLLSRGYDEEHQIFTVEAIPFDEELGIEAAKERLAGWLKGYPFRDPRSLGAHVAAMISSFVRLMLPQGSKRPMVIYKANQMGTGKTTLALMAITPVFGPPNNQTPERDPAELRKVLDTCAIERRQYLFLDDMRDLKSQALNSFLTAANVAPRVLGMSKSSPSPVEAQVFLTGNQLDVGSELARRSIIVDLFFAGSPAERDFPHEITAPWLNRPQVRAEFLAVFWAVVRHWHAQGCPRCTGRPRPSFEDYSRLVGGMVEAFGYSDPITQDNSLVDKETEAIIALLKIAAETVTPGRKGEDFRPADFLTMAKANDLADILLPGSYKGEGGECKALGHKLAKWKGRELRRSTDGKMFEFGDLSRSTTLYRLTVYDS